VQVVAVQANHLCGLIVRHCHPSILDCDSERRRDRSGNRCWMKPPSPNGQNIETVARTGSYPLCVPKTSSQLAPNRIIY
jgi:hypothetical protein